ncbi:hypothetical protein [Achromobacter sp. 2789STDY5608628]|uniref:hypothetical protein n=1 Tax=Achromobacter sp. 2789STDY5608628 TaxID=1806493 RepID=UPI0012E24A91|nr:hypothetical protein [Achromobacter sp. 2789STDY5608628]
MGGVVKKVLKPVSKLVGGVLGGGEDAPKLPEGPSAEEVEARAAAKTAAEKLAAENEAAALANASAAERNRQRKAGSLLASGAGSGGNAQTSSVLAYGKARLGE